MTVSVSGRRLGAFTTSGRRLNFYLGPPVVAFLVSTLILFWAAVAAGTHFTSAIDWVRWDSGFYQQIAGSGYVLVRCADHHTWCGNAGWFPGYPALLAPLLSLGLPLEQTSVLIPWIFDFALLTLLWNGFLRDGASVSRYAALGFAAFVPGGVYMHTAFPCSMTVFFVLLCLYWLRRCLLYTAAVAGALAAFCYPRALLLAAIVGLWALVERRDAGWWTRLYQGAAGAAIVCMGLVAACAVEAAQTGRWNAYFLVQAHYGHGFHEPFSILWPQIQAAFNGVTGQTGTMDWYAVQVAVICLLVIGLTITRLARGDGSRWDVVILTLIFGFWMIPLTQANLSYWREGVMLTPAAILISEYGAWSAATIVGIALAGFPTLGYFFFAGSLV